MGPIERFPPDVKLVLLGSLDVAVGRVSAIISALVVGMIWTGRRNLAERLRQHAPPGVGTSLAPVPV